MDPSVIIRILKSAKGKQKKRSEVRGHDVRAQATIAGFEDGGKAPSGKHYKQPVEVTKGRETDFSIEPPEKNAVLSTP